MKINSIRLGFANNSSSAHSILLNANLKSNEDDVYYRDWFVLNSSESKLHYLAAQVYTNLYPMPSEYRTIIIKDLFGIEITNDVVDHQSTWSLPYSGQIINEEFLRDLQKYLLKSNITILGGNDETDCPYNIKPEQHVNLPIPKDTSEKFLARKDKNWWVLFNYRTGAKIRFSFEDELSYPYATYPELVDLKITSQCHSNCPWCYQNSNSNGIHGDWRFIDDIIDKLAEVGVMEIALGGGEPTLHPEFESIIYHAAYSGVVPNFSTSQTDWMSTNLAKEVEENCGSFAVSLIDNKTLRRLVKWNETHKVKATCQIALGIYPEENIIKAMRFIRNRNVPITLLGFKNCGRGKNFSSFPYNKVLKELNQWYSFGADTSFVNLHKDWLEGNKIAPELIIGAEGCFSMYIDAVNKQVGKSSFEKTKKFNDIEEILEDFPYIS